MHELTASFTGRLPADQISNGAAKPNTFGGGAYARGIKPELEVLELGMINTAKLLIGKGLVPPPYYFNILLGSRHTTAATALNLSVAIAGLPCQSVWSGTGLGRFQVPVNMLSIAMGGHVRTGVEDNLYYDHERSRLASNEDLVRRAMQEILESGLPEREKRITLRTIDDLWADHLAAIAREHGPARTCFLISRIIERARSSRTIRSRLAVAFQWISS